jgi:hypothetical protein
MLVICIIKVGGRIREPPSKLRPISFLKRSKVTETLEIKLCYMFIAS